MAEQARRSHPPHLRHPPHPSPLPEGEGATRPELQVGASDKRKGAGQAPFYMVMRTGNSGPQTTNPIPDLSG